MNPLVNVWEHAFRFCIGLALVLCLLTYVLFEHVQHYESVSGELLVNPTFEQGLLGWRSSKLVDRDQLDTIDLSNWHPAEMQSIWQVIPVPETRAMKLTAIYSLKDVTQGLERWHNARLSVGGRRQQEKWRWDFRGTVFEGTGTLTQGLSTAIVLIPKGVNELRVEFGLGGGTGEFRVDEIQTAMVKPKYHIVMLIEVLKFCWVALAVMVVIAMISRGLWMTVPVVSLIMFLLLFIPKSQKEHLLEWSDALWSSFLPASWQIDFDHLVLFILLSTFVDIYLKLLKTSIAGYRVLLSLVTIAISLEVLQYFADFRRVNLGDAAVNIIGAVIPFGISRLLILVSRRRVKIDNARAM